MQPNPVWVNRSYLWEDVTLAAIRIGDVETAAALPLADESVHPGRLARTELRNAQNCAIVQTTLATRAAIDGGCCSPPAAEMSLLTPGSRDAQQTRQGASRT